MEEAKAHKIIYDDHEQAGDKYNYFFATCSYSFFLLLCLLFVSALVFFTLFVAFCSLWKMFNRKSTAAIPIIITLFSLKKKTYALSQPDTQTCFCYFASELFVSDWIESLSLSLLRWNWYWFEMKLQIALDLFTLKILRTFFTSSRKNMLLDRWKLEKRHKTKRKSCVMCSAFDAIFATTAMMIIMMKDDKYTCRHHHHIHCQRHFLIAFSRCDLFFDNNIMHLHSILSTKSRAACCLLYWRTWWWHTYNQAENTTRHQCSYFMRQLAESTTAEK